MREQNPKRVKADTKLMQIVNALLPPGIYGSANQIGSRIKNGVLHVYSIRVTRFRGQATKVSVKRKVRHLNEKKD